MKLQDSPTQLITFQNRKFYIKRDDLLHNDFSGNKARKFNYFLENDFPNIKKVISHGSNQSNAMYSLSVLCQQKGWLFEYYTNHVPSFLLANPIGNYKASIDNGMKLIIDDFDTLSIKEDDSTLIINEGGAIKEAKWGIDILANEINNWKKTNNIQNLKIFLPSGTGTTALFLQESMQDEVCTCPCVGDATYLHKQFMQLKSNNKKYPTILQPSKKFHFGKLYKENYLIWKDLLETTAVEFDLLYDPIGWQTLLENIQYFDEYNILYIHQGGLKGNETMKLRYERKLYSS